MLKRLLQNPVNSFFFYFIIINAFLHLIVEIPGLQNARNKLFYGAEVVVLNQWHPYWYFEFKLKDPTQGYTNQDVTLYAYLKKEIKDYRLKLKRSANLPNIKYKRKIDFEAAFVWNVPLFLLWGLILATPKIGWIRRSISLLIATYMLLLLIAMKITVMTDMKDGQDIDTVWHKVSSFFGTIDAYLELFFLFPLIIWLLLWVDRKTFSSA